MKRSARCSRWCKRSDCRCGSADLAIYSYVEVSSPKPAPPCRPSCASSRILSVPPSTWRCCVGSLATMRRRPRPNRRCWDLWSHPAVVQTRAVQASAPEPRCCWPSSRWLQIPWPAQKPERCCTKLRRWCQQATCCFWKRSRARKWESATTRLPQPCKSKCYSACRTDDARGCYWRKRCWRPGLAPRLIASWHH